VILNQLLERLEDEKALDSLFGRRSATLAVAEPARAIVLASLIERAERRPVVVAVPTGSEAERLSNDLKNFLEPSEVALFPAWETLPFERVSPAIETMGRRMQILHQLSDPKTCPKVIVASGKALVQQVGPYSKRRKPLKLILNEEIDQSEVISTLVSVGYRREYQVEHRGEFAVRGSIIDLWPSTSEAPIRVDLWGDEIERLTEFSVATQRSTLEYKEVEVFPCRELLPTEEVKERAQQLIAEQPWGREQWERLTNGELFDGMESWLPWITPQAQVLFDFIGDNGLVVLVEPRRLRDRISDLRAEEADLVAVLADTWGAENNEFPQLHTKWERLLEHTDSPRWSIDATPEGPESSIVPAHGWGRSAGGEESAVQSLSKLLSDGYQVLLVADGDGTANRLTENMAKEGIELQRSSEPPNFSNPSGQITVGSLERGFVLTNSRLAVITEAELTGRRRTHRPRGPRRKAAVRVFEDLHPGDYVVHEFHGVAKFSGLVTRTLGGVERDYLLLEYRGDDRLYLPTDQIDAIRPYTGGDSPTLSRMGGADWERSRARVRSAASEIAQELVLLYQKRITTKGHSFGPDTPWQQEMEQSFPFQETPDQNSAIKSVKEDMENSLPMDRLVCGDVGFGKTEIAIRAVFKAVQDGKQAAVLVPTTLLAQQHGQTFADRFAPYPIRVEVLSRFLTAAESRRVIRDIQDGTVDVVIGTHRLLSGDVEFQKLGLLVVDEEQRFGVTHKEAIKQIKSNVDVLTLTATPIPRTLEMSLTGIRDLSLLNTPPADRQPILTYVGEYDERAAVEAIRRELLREGQVFFVHNRVADIEQVAGGLKELVPEARIAVAHGQMEESALESVVLDFWEGSYDVLVCTTIIESGIDMPTVNTLVVDRADLLGLGQMHQLRGRVGRAGQRAYAYLFTPTDRSLSEEAYERLRTIGETTELGSGFRIAMRDLEIRGAGNILGTGQSGHIAAVGYDLYCQMVTEAVAELTGKTSEKPLEIRVEIPVDAHLPKDYVSRSDLRLEAYRRLASAGINSEIESVDEVQAEWEDRYGPVPDPAMALLAVGRLRALCAQLGISEVIVSRVPGGFDPGRAEYVARCSPVDLPLSRQARLQRLFEGSIYKTDQKVLHLPIPQPLDEGAPGELAIKLSEMLKDLVPTADSADSPITS
jgi:transcription-repair coupling factor (superfamily II helicase)